MRRSGLDDLDALCTRSRTRPDRQRQGIGGALVLAASEIADHLDEPVIVLEGHPSYYPSVWLRARRRSSSHLPIVGRANTLHS